MLHLSGPSPIRTLSFHIVPEYYRRLLTKYSRRIKVKITVQSEVSEGAIMQQSFVVEYTQNYQQCTYD